MYFKKYMQQKPETLAEYLTRLMEEKNLSGYDIERITKKGITQSYVNRLKNGDNTNPSIDAIKALAKGLSVPEEQLSAIALGYKLSDDDIERIELDAMYRKRKKLSPKRKDEFRNILQMVDRELDRLYEEELKEENNN